MDESFFSLIREEATKATWSQGVGLARTRKLFLESDRDGEVSFLARDPGLARAVQVRLIPGEEDWQCDCRLGDDPCRHVVAAAIAMKQRNLGDGMLAEKAPSRLGYEIEATAGGPRLLRFLYAEDGRLQEPASSAFSPNSGVALCEADWAIEKKISAQKHGLLTAQTWLRIRRDLDQVARLIFEGETVRFLLGQDEIVITQTVPGASVRLQRDPRARRALGAGLWAGPGIILCGSEQGSSATEHWHRRDFGELFGRRIWSYEAPVRIIGRGLPWYLPCKPYVALVWHSQSLRPELRYGKPPVARLAPDGTFELLDQYYPKRDPEAEVRLKQLIEARYQLRLGEGVELSDAAAHRWAGKPVPEGVMIDPSLRRQFGQIHHMTPKVERSPDGGASVSFEAAGQTLDFQRVYRAWSDREDLIRLEGGGLAEIPGTWLEAYGHLAKDILGGQVNEAAARLAVEAAPAGAFKEALEHVFPKLTITSNVIPPSVEPLLRSYQRDGVRWLLQLKAWSLGGLLYDEMGLGKTLQALCSLESRSLVVVPRSLLCHWQDEIEKFRPELQVNLYHGANRTPRFDQGVTITSYGTLRRDQDLFARKKFRALILDEAHMVKNPDSQSYGAVSRVSADFSLILTGTPIENSIGDLWAYFALLVPGLLGSRQDFLAAFRGRERLESLKARLSPFMLGRAKEDVAKELPAKTVQVVPCLLSEEEAGAYSALVAEVKAQSKENPIKLLSGLTRLRQACCHLSLLPGDWPRLSSKCDTLMGYLEELIPRGHRCLVFSSWTKFLDLIEEELTYPSLRLDGSTRDRGKVVTDFQNGAAPILLMTMKAGGVGLNLTAADHVFIMDPWWNPAVEQQALARAHRIGQDKPVFVYRLIARGSIEEAIEKMKAEKSSLARDVLESDTPPMESLRALVDGLHPL